MIRLQEIYKLCEGFENVERKASIRELRNKRYSENKATSYYNIWRRHYIEVSSEDLKLSGVYIQDGNRRKPIELCPYNERQKYLEALSKEQLIKVTQSVLK